MLVKAKRLPSGEKTTVPIRALAGTTTVRGGADPDTGRNVMPVPEGIRCGPLFCGSIRSPAMRSIGREISAIDGMLRREMTAITS